MKSLIKLLVFLAIVVVAQAQNNEFPSFADCEKETELRLQKKCFDLNVKSNLKQQFLNQLSDKSLSKYTNVSLYFKVDKSGKFNLTRVEPKTQKLQKEILKVFANFPNVKPVMSNGRAFSSDYKINLSYPFDKNKIQVSEITPVVSPPAPKPPPAPEILNDIEEEEEIEEEISLSPEVSEKRINIIQEGQEEENIPLALIDESPIYPGCETATDTKSCLTKNISDFVSENFDKSFASKLGVSGKIRIFLQFTIDKNGDITDVKARAPHPKLEKEAISVMKRIPKMKPSIHQAQKVNVIYALPISFKI